MGMEHVVRFPGTGSPALSRVIALLVEHKYPVQVRMVDGELTLPDEDLPETWTDVRLGTPAGMVTILRREHDWSVVTWGNADDTMVRAWNALAWAVAQAGEGEIIGPEGAMGPQDFRRIVPMPDALRV